MPDAFVGEISIFTGPNPPDGWLPCLGQSAPRARFPALFSVIGTRFGSNSQLEFTLPDLSGRVPIGVGKGAGLTEYTLAQSGGVESVTLTEEQIPSHSHPLYATTSAASQTSPEGMLSAVTSSPTYGSGGNLVAMSFLSIGSVGENIAHENRMPYLAVNFCICYVGVMPVQSS